MKNNDMRVVVTINNKRPILWKRIASYFRDLKSTESKITREKESTNHFYFIFNSLTNNDYRKQVFYWHQVKLDDSLSLGSRGAIESIKKAPVKVIFDNEEIKRAMTSNDERFSKPWQDLAYLVDVEVSTIKDIVKAYKIMRVYTEDTFDPDFA